MRPPLEALTPCEQRIVRLVMRGLSNREIGVVIDWSEKGVKHQLSAIYAKLELSGLRVAKRNKLIYLGGYSDGLKAATREQESET